MNRRDFLNRMAVMVAVAAGDPTALLWTPGEKKIFVPKVVGNYSQWCQYQTFASRRAAWLSLLEGVDGFGPKLGTFNVFAGGTDILAQIERGNARARELGFE